jgi:hypothetical protein
MKKILSFCVVYLLLTSVNAQQNPASTTTTSKSKKKIDLSGRANDHLLIQLGYTGWSGKPDTVRTGGFSRSLNVYLMFDFPFKTNPKLSVALGPGISSDHIKFTKTYVDVKGTTSTLRFIDQSDTNHFKRNKLATSYLEVPVEFRYASDPENSGRGLRAAIGVKVGTMLNAHTRYREMQTKAGALVNSYGLKEASKRYFNTTRLVAYGRVGWGHLSVYASYQVSALFKTGVAAEIHPYSIGLTLSGL